MAIIIHELEHRYEDGSAGEKVALHDVNIKIEQGEMIGLIGHTGSGKSTLIQHLNGLPGRSFTMERTSMTATFPRRNFAVKLDLYFNIRSISCLRVR